MTVPAVLDAVTPVRIGLLGPVRAWIGERLVPVGPPRQQALLAVLATNANQVISRAELIDALWGATPPATAAGNVHTYVAGLRRVLEPDRREGAPYQVLVSAGSGYCLRLPEQSVDAERFAAARQQARTLLAAGEAAGALRALDQALGLCVGTPLGTITGPFADVERARLSELRLDVVEERGEVLLRMGRHAELVEELAAVLADHPLRESARALLIRALLAQGRRDSAVEVYQAGEQVLSERLGVQPGPVLRELHDTLLARDKPAAADPTRAVPSQLPHDTRRFTGRGEELTRLNGLLPPLTAPTTGGTVVITTIEGTAGIGKTSLAVHWSHRVRDRFPDGQLYLNLRGFDVAGDPVSTHDALYTLLTAFGVSSEKIPTALDERSALFRSIASGRRLLLVLDNAVSTEQVHPLLPANQSCVVLVTSRNRLDGLAATGDARQLTLGLFGPQDSAELLAGYLDPERIAEDRAAFEELIQLCAGLPLALSIVGARAWCSPNLPLAQFVDELRDAHFRLDALDTGDDVSSNVRAVFSWSYDALSPQAARMFRLLGLHEGEDISGHAAGALADVTGPETEALLEELVRAHLLEERGDGRYQFHDLLAVYALERAFEEEDEETRHAAGRRSAWWYLHAANSADRVMIPQKAVHDIVAPPRHWTFADPADPAQCRAWFAAEEANIVSAIRRAAQLGEHGVAWRLPQTMSSFWYVYNKRWDLWLEMLELSLHQAGLDGSTSGIANGHAALGVVYNDLRRYEEAVTHYRLALEVYPDTEDRWMEGIATNALANTYVAMGRFDEAMPCLRRAAELFERIGNHWGAAWALQGTASAYLAMGRHEEALDYGHRSLTAWREVGYVHGVGSALTVLGQVHLAMERFEEAVDHYDQAIEVRESIDDRFGLARALHSRGVALLGCGRTDQARQSLTRALHILTGMGAPEAEEVAQRLADLDG
ncbi:BTAD domain-containing putative transcriptional regulator [Kutzneria viridogrisea]|uniref:OmpR/PhoB-type domain-containing protein n=2 Tax=Kutzneria TaxID=43356 RepID=W5W872_9PSEU|nr:BTAD domain-containing putative transcriptional regulator [Kutzneria albida]AHH96721.1 hypothetical protein KALB_3354 [Kutzneria albida DSM 43870]MBA8928059.1 DNA-binding SARP family transcriptional activator/Flp pilus assembly protein TadD [Kutzneria viridogrisea]